jgi:tripartite-type tricarboxylate transporter receptor subunit TctC
MKRRSFVKAGIAGALPIAAGSPLVVSAQAAWPQKPVHIVVPYAPGGSADTLGRIAARPLADALGQAFVVDNKIGAGGTIGSQQVSRAAPDGYTLVVSGIGSHVIAPLQQVKPPFDAMKDFTHVAMLGGPPIVLAVNASVPVTDLKGFIDYVNKQPQGLSWGSPGQGTHGYLIGEVFAATHKLKMVHISYGGASQAIADLLANQIPAAFMTLNSAGPHIVSGKLRGLAITAQKPLPQYPQTPTFAELGYPNLTAITWFSLSGPAGLPEPVVKLLNTEVRKALKSPEVQAHFLREGIESYDMDATAFTKYVKSQIDYWRPYVKNIPT